ncbi:MAG: NAD(P)/FAD-dependent oxidoreductase [Rhizobiaceae bacterium]
MNNGFDFIVIGAGITGAATACQMARAGHKVLVIDRFGPAAMGSGWTLAGVRQSGRHAAELPLAKAAVDLWATLDADLGGPTHYTRKGNLRLARNEQEYGQIKAMVEQQSSDGLGLSFLSDNAALRAVAPALAADIPGASFCPSDGHADPIATVTAFVAAARRAGAEFRDSERVMHLLVEHGRVRGVETDKARYSTGRVVLAAGMAGTELLAPLGIDLPITVRMVTVVRSVPAEPMLDQVLGVCGGGWAGRQEVSGRFRVTSGGQPWHGRMGFRQTAEGTRPEVQPPIASLSQVADEMARLLPGAVETPVEAIWAGLIDMTPDALPVLDAAPNVEGLVLGMGFSGHGFCLGPITGRILAALALSEEPGFDLKPFAVDRFKGRTDAAEQEMTLHG